MIAYLQGKIIDKKDNTLVIDVSGVGYEVFCSPSTVSTFGEMGTPIQLFIHTQYRTDGASLFGFASSQEKELFLSLIKVDSVGPKSALNILSAAPWDEIVHLVEEGDVAALSKLPKVSKKTAEHVVVKLKGKLSELLLKASPDKPLVHKKGESRQRLMKMRVEAQTALAHLGFRPQDVDKTLTDIGEEVWQGDLQSVIRQALTDLSGNN